MSHYELQQRLNALVNRYGSIEEFVRHIDDWPRTIKELIYNSQELMVHFGLVELIPEVDESEFIGVEQ